MRLFVVSGLFLLLSGTLASSSSFKQRALLQSQGAGSSVVGTTSLYTPTSEGGLFLVRLPHFRSDLPVTAAQLPLLVSNNARLLFSYFLKPFGQNQQVLPGFNNFGSSRRDLLVVSPDRLSSPFCL